MTSLGNGSFKHIQQITLWSRRQARSRSSASDVRNLRPAPSGHSRWRCASHYHQIVPLGLWACHADHDRAILRLSPAWLGVLGAHFGWTTTTEFWSPLPIERVRFVALREHLLTPLLRHQLVALTGNFGPNRFSVT